MTHYDTCFELLIGHEGKLSLDPKDRGNWTDGNYGRSGGKLVGSMYGVSAMSYPRVDIRNLTLAQAKLIYKRDYWDRVEADTLEPALAFAAFDTAVNAGVGRARGYLQQTGDWRELLSRRLLDYTDFNAWESQGKGWARRIARVFSECAGFEVKPTPIERVFVNSRELTVVKQSQVGNKLYLNTEV